MYERQKCVNLGIWSTEHIKYMDEGIIEMEMYEIGLNSWYIIFILKIADKSSNLA